MATYTPWSGVTAAEIKNQAQVTSDDLGFANDTAYTDWVTDDLISEAEAFVESECHRDFSVDYSTIPNDVKGLIRRLVSKAIQVVMINRAGPYYRITDYRIEWANRDICDEACLRIIRNYVKMTRKVKKSAAQTDDYAERWSE